jgi:threonine/homoserine/homoserine lactone efflux protein
VKLAGVLCLSVIGVRTLRQPPPQLSGAPDGLGAVVALRRALLTNLLNPKVALFFLAFIPQIVQPERGPLFLQFVLLGSIVSMAGLSFGSTLALAAGSLAEWLRRHPSFGRWQQRIMGSVLLGLAARLAFTRAD